MAVMAVPNTKIAARQLLATLSSVILKKVNAIDNKILKSLVESHHYLTFKKEHSPVQPLTEHRAENTENL